MFYQSKSFLTLAFACSLLLAGCETPSVGMKAKHDPVPLQAAEAKPLTAPLANGSNEDKLAKLEAQIIALQQEVAATRPKIAKIDLIEQKFKDLSLGLDRIDATYNMVPEKAAPASASAPVHAPVVEKPVPMKPAAAAPPPPPKPVAKPVVKETEKAPVKPAKTETPKPPAISGSKAVEGLRIGEQKNFSRLVLDLGQVSKVTYDIDNDEKILVVEIPGLAWNAAKTKTFPTSNLIASYQAESDAKGSHLVIQLKKPAKIAKYSTLDASAGKLPRAVIDVAAQ